MRAKILEKNILFLLVLIASILLRSGNLKSQEIEKYRLSLRSHLGYVLTHRPYMAVFNEGHVPAMEISFSKKMVGEEKWKSDFLNPDLGLSFIAMDLGNKKLLGNGYGVFWFFNLPLLKSNFLAYSLKAGQGFGYVQKKFEVKDNYKNFANSTHLTGFVYLNNVLAVPVTSDLNVSLGLSFLHFSNGGFNKPNLGLNIPAINFGIDYKIGRQDFKGLPVEKSPKRNEGRKGSEVFVALNTAVKERRPAQNNNFKVFALNVSKSYTRNQMSYWGYGLDFFYDEAMKKELEKKGDLSPNFVDKLRVGVHLSYILRVGRVDYVVQPGFYLHSKYKGDGFMYHRIGTRYHLSNKLVLNTTLKTHFAVADHFEFGFAYKLK